MFKKLFAAFLALSCTACAFTACKGGGDSSSSAPSSETSDSSVSSAAQQLNAPYGLFYDKASSVLSWTGDGNAVAYKISCNGQLIDADANDTQEVITVTADEITFQVKAVGDGVHYSDSDWSEAFTYEISVYDKVNRALSAAAEQEDLELVSIVGIEDFNKKNITFETLCKNTYGKISNVEIYSYNSTAGTVDYLLRNLDQSEITSSNQKTIVDYDSAQYLLDSGSYDGEMQKLYNEGYTISVVHSCVRQGSKVGTKFRFEIVGTYKAVRGTEVKYFTSINRIDILLPEAEEDNYETFLWDRGLSTVVETSFVLHEAGGTWLYMEDWAKAYDTAE